MMLLDRRMKGIPLTFIVVLVATIILTIFLGAWAVSADVEARDGSFYFPLTAGGTSLSSASTEQARGPAGAADRAIGEEDATNADTWWGSFVLKACPLH